MTQFEAGTAVALLALARARVDAGVIEAGLGGRLDATNVIPSKVTALTSIALEHTELLGETEEEIAAEKLAVLRPHSTLVVGGVSAAVADLADATARERSAAIVHVPAATAGVPVAVTGAYPRRNFAVALAAAEAFLGQALDPDAVERAAAESSLPARLETVAGDPPLILDAAHNPAGVEAARRGAAGPRRRQARRGAARGALREADRRALRAARRGLRDDRLHRDPSRGARRGRAARGAAAPGGGPGRGLRDAPVAGRRR